MNRRSPPGVLGPVQAARRARGRELAVRRSWPAAPGTETVRQPPSWCVVVALGLAACAAPGGSTGRSAFRDVPPPPDCCAAEDSDHPEPEDTAEAVDSSDPGDSAPPPQDADGDGFSEDVDCDDDNATVCPGAPELCGDGLANDCDGDGFGLWAACRTMSSPQARASIRVTPSGSDNIRVINAGDVDGDGVDDVAVSHVAEWVESADLEVVWLRGGVFLFTAELNGAHYHGDEDQLTVGVSGQVVDGESQDDFLGGDLQPAGDVDGDGYADLLVGASDPAMSGPETPSNTPSVYLLHGPDISGVADEHTVVLGPATDDTRCQGSVLASVADVDGDGQSDVATSFRYDAEVHIYSSGAEHQVPGVDQLATFLGPGEFTASRFGHLMVGQDMNGDGIEDLAISATEMGEWEQLGFVSIFEGPHEGTRTWEDAAATIQPVSADTALYRDRASMFFGTAMAVTDLDGDGHPDLVAGAPLTSVDPSGTTAVEGLIAVYRGPLDNRSGLGEADAIVYGDASTILFGGDLDVAQDLDGDGAPDIVVGNGHKEVYGGESGRTFSYHVRNAHVFFGPMTSGTWTAADADIRFEFPDDETFMGAEIASLGDTNGDGFSEVLVSDGGRMTYLFDMPTW